MTQTDHRAPAVSVQGVGVTFHSDAGRVEALQGVDLDIKPGEFVTLIGPSGCGKTTLLNVIAGLLPPTQGRVEVAGAPVIGPPPEVGMMFQKSVLLDWRRIRDNVLLPVELDRGSKAAKQARGEADRLLAAVGLKGFERSYPKQLSGGMQQRAAICRMLISDPQVLLLDEPFGALDELTREDLNVQLSRIIEGTDKAALLVTHSIQEGVFLSDRVVVLSSRPGRIAEIIKVDLPRPRNLDVIKSQEFNSYAAAVRTALEGSHAGDTGGDLTRSSESSRKGATS